MLTRNITTIFLETSIFCGIFYIHDAKIHIISCLLIAYSACIFHKKVSI
jgi:hypothetical protein